MPGLPENVGALPHYAFGTALEMKMAADGTSWKISGSGDRRLAVAPHQPYRALGGIAQDLIPNHGR